MTKKKLATMAIAGVLATSLAIGGATYALFTGSTTNANNMFKAGKLELSSHRHDIPIEGPMFYTNDNVNGWMGTGLWAPGDIHTRAMFIYHTNNSTLDAKLSKLNAIPIDSNGNEVTTGTEYDQAMAFGEEARVTIAVFDGQGLLDERIIRALNEENDRFYKNLPKFLKKPWGELTAELIREAYLNHVFRIDNNGNPLDIRATAVYVGRLSDLYNNGNGVSPLANLELRKGHTLYMGYTVHFDQDAGNDLQGNNAMFKFVTEFEQLRNNN